MLPNPRLQDAVISHLLLPGGKTLIPPLTYFSQETGRRNLPPIYHCQETGLNSSTNVLFTGHIRLSRFLVPG